MVYGGTTLNFDNYRFGKSFFGRCFSWAEFQAQCLRLISDVDLIHSFSFWPERFFLLNKIKKPILYRQGNPPSKRDFMGARPLPPAIQIIGVFFSLK